MATLLEPTPIVTRPHPERRPSKGSMFLLLLCGRVSVATVRRLPERAPRRIIARMQVAAGGSGGDPDAHRAMAQWWQRRSAPPENEAGVMVEANAVVAATEDLAVLLQGALVYRGGVELQLGLVSRRDPGDGDRRMELHTSFSGAPRSGQGGMLAGAELGDGRRASTLDRPRPGLDAALPDDTTPTLIRTGASGSGRTFRVSLYLAPAPPPGPLRLVFAWPGGGVAETTVELPGDRIAAAAASVRILWPHEPPAPPRRPEPAPLPPGGWFDRTGLR